MMTDKIKSRAELRRVLKREKKAGKKVVFTNGCFDLLHPGHTSYLTEAKGLGDLLIVALNSDNSVRAIKMEGRPILAEAERLEVMAALACVDFVTVFDEPDPLGIIEELEPDVLVKGGDWTEDAIIGGDFVKAAGGEVRSIPYREGLSTSRIIRRILERFGNRA